jgi:hypothetical protein
VFAKHTGHPIPSIAKTFDKQIQKLEMSIANKRFIYISNFFIYLSKVFVMGRIG